MSMALIDILEYRIRVVQIRGLEHRWGLERSTFFALRIVAPASRVALAIHLLEDYAELVIIVILIT